LLGDLGDLDHRRLPDPQRTDRLDVAKRQDGGRTGGLELGPVDRCVEGEAVGGGRHVDAAHGQRLEVGRDQCPRPAQLAGREGAVLAHRQLQLREARCAEQFSAGEQPAEGLVVTTGEVAVDGQQAVDPLAHAAGPFAVGVGAGDLVVGEDGPQRHGGVGGDAGDVDPQRRLVPYEFEPLDPGSDRTAGEDPEAGRDTGLDGEGDRSGGGVGQGRRGEGAEERRSSGQSDRGDGRQRPGQPHRHPPCSSSLSAVSFGMTGASSSPVRAGDGGVAGNVPD
jgi:hypothetical protein